jgi:tripartite-type tricarboxylate transporter receptor subunit TctC
MLKYLCVLLSILACGPAYSQQKIEIVTKVAITNVAGQFLYMFVEKLNEYQKDYEFRLTTIPGSAGEGAYNRVVQLKQAILFGNQTFFSNPKTNENKRVDNFEFLTTLNVSYAAIMVNRDSNIRTVQQLIESLQNKQKAFYAGSLNSSGGGPVLNKIFLDKYKLENKVNVILYKNIQDRIRAVAINEADYVINNPASANVGSDNGTLQILVMASNSRLDAYPNVPTGAEVGMPEFNYAAFNTFAILKSEQKLIKILSPIFQKVCADKNIQNLINAKNHTPICEQNDYVKDTVKRESEMFKQMNIDFEVD